MKKALSLIILTLVSALLCYTSVLAYSQITETPNVKIIIEGQIAKFEHTPIITEGRTMLPFREALIKLGVPNDEEHIKWNDTDKSIIVNCEIGGKKKTIEMRIDSNLASINGNQEKLDVVPIIYKDSTYIPVRFISQALGKTVVWDGSTTTVLIRDTDSFNHVKDILTKVKEASSKKKHLETNSNVIMDMKIKEADSDKTTEINTNISQKIELDAEKMIVHINQTMPYPDPSEKRDINSNIYLIDGIMYIQDPSTKQWTKSSIAKDMIDNLLSQSNDSNLEMTDVICAGLIEDVDANNGKIKLKGNVYFKDMLDRMLSSYKNPNLDMKIDFKNLYLEIVIDKDTYLVEKEYIEMTLNMDLGSEGSLEISTKSDISIKYVDSIVIPSEVLNAKEMTIPGFN